MLIQKLAKNFCAFCEGIYVELFLELYLIEVYPIEVYHIGKCVVEEVLGLSPEGPNYWCALGLICVRVRVRGRVLKIRLLLPHAYH